MISAIQSMTADGANHVLAALRSASAKTGLDFDFLLNTAMRESSLNSQAKSKGSSASGLFQFIDQTWLGLVKQFGNRYGLGSYAGAIQQNGAGQYTVASAETKSAILALRQDPEVSALMAGESAKQTKQSLECALGRAVCGGELYAAHFLGPSGARRLIQLSETDPGARADVAFPQAAKGNKAAFYRADGTAKTVGELYAWVVDRPAVPTAMPSLKDLAPKPQMIAVNDPAPEMKNVLAPVTTPDTTEQANTAEPNGSGEQQPLFGNLNRWMAGRAPRTVELRPLPQPPMLLSAGVMEVLASLSPLTTSRQAA